MWERFCQISQRVILAKSTHQLLQQLCESERNNEDSEGDQEKLKLLKSLTDEISMLTEVKNQLEEAISRCFVRDISTRTSINTSSPAFAESTTQSNIGNFNDGSADNQSCVSTSCNVNHKLTTDSYSSSDNDIFKRNSQGYSRLEDATRNLQGITELPDSSDLGKNSNSKLDVLLSVSSHIEEGESIQSLKRKAPQQLLAYRNRIGPGSMKRQNISSKPYAEIQTHGNNSVSDAEIKKVSDFERADLAVELVSLAKATNSPTREKKQIEYIVIDGTNDEKVLIEDVQTTCV